ncbi:MAG: single-stranded DNA-binding protein [Clostridiales bacterium]|jgi:single-strand DNA-binding protein|nr:single-stranded DNA-binding protein [Clostridiales bacterium]
MNARFAGSAKKQRKAAVPINSVQLLGRLTAEPTIRYTQQQVPVASFTLAVPRNKQKEQDAVTDFFNIIAWRQKAEFAENYLKKGQRIAVSGELQNRSYEKDGVRHWITEIIAENIDFADGKDGH